MTGKKKKLGHGLRGWHGFFYGDGMGLTMMNEDEGDGMSFDCVRREERLLAPLRTVGIENRFFVGQACSLTRLMIEFY